MDSNTDTFENNPNNTQPEEQNKDEAKEDPGTTSRTSTDLNQSSTAVQETNEAAGTNDQLSDRDTDHNSVNEELDTVTNEDSMDKDSKSRSAKSKRTEKSDVGIKDENRMYSPDDELNIDDFMKNLEQGNLQLTKELHEWRENYGIDLEQNETDNILNGNPSLGGLGLSEEEQEIASVVMKGKLQELRTMSVDEMVDYVRLSSY